jgi:hypothetical protein
MINSGLIQAKTRSPQEPTLPEHSCKSLDLKLNDGVRLHYGPVGPCRGRVNGEDGIRLGKPHVDSQAVIHSHNVER